MEKIIFLKPASAADDLRCDDGELANFPSGPSFSTQPEPELPLDHFSSLREISVPAGAEFLAMHVLPDGTANAIIRLADGSFAYMRDGSSAPIPADRQFHATLKAGGVGPWLVILTDTYLLYSCWNGAGYSRLGEAPGAPEGVFSTTTKALPPYSYVEGQLPRLSVKVPIGKDSAGDVLNWLAGRDSECSSPTRLNIISNVADKFREFLADARAAGLYLSPVRAAAAWRLPDGTLWQRSAATTLRPSNERMALQISAADCDDEFLYLTLTVSRAPFAVSFSRLDSIREEWKDVCSGVQLLVSDNVRDFEADGIDSPVWLSSADRGFMLPARSFSDSDFSPFPPVCNSMVSDGTPDDIFSINGRLYAARGARIYASHISASSGSSLSSLSSFPMVCSASGALGSGNIHYITGSLRSLSSPAVGDSPLYVFSSAGIHAFTPKGNGLSEVQLISRHSAFPGSFAPLPDGTAFISEAGVMKLSGTKVSKLNEGFEFYPSETHRLLYVYRENSLLLYRPREDGIWAYDFGLNKWRPVTGCITSHHYAWPYAYFISATANTPVTIAVGANDLAAVTDSSSESVLLPIKTRPLKLGDPFAIKKLEEIEASWPDGTCYPIRVYGALKLGRWHFLGATSRGRMRMRGSGWRFFRVDTFAPQTASATLLPLLKLHL